MNPLLIYVQIVGPVLNPDIKKEVHQVEMGVQEKDAKDSHMVNLAIPTSNPVEAIDTIIPQLKAFIEKYYPKHTTKETTNESTI